MHEKIIELAALMDYKWHDRQNRVIFTTKEKRSRRVYMFRINSRDRMIRVYINNLVIITPISRMFIEMTDSHIEHDRQQYSTDFYHTCDYSFVSFQLCLEAVKKKLLFYGMACGIRCGCRDLNGVTAHRRIKDEA